MATWDIYDTGTAQVANGGTTVSGSGTLWEGNPVAPMILPGDKLYKSGVSVPIESVTDDDTIVLAAPWPNSSLASATTYDILMESPLRVDGDRIGKAVRDFLQRLTDSEMTIIYYSNSTPDDGIGNDGDYAIQASGGAWTLWYKDAGAWDTATTASTAFGNNAGIVDGNANEQLLFGQTASAVNYWKMTNSATGNAVTLEAAGGDTNISAKISSKGTGQVQFAINGTNEVFLSSAQFGPSASGGSQLGSTGNMWGALFIDDSGTINFNAGDVVITHSSNLLTVTGGNISINADSDGAAGTVSNAPTFTLHDTDTGGSWDIVNPFVAIQFSSDDTTTLGAGVRHAIGAVMSAVAGSSSRIALFGAPSTAGTLVEYWSLGNAGGVGQGIAPVAGMRYAIGGTARTASNDSYGININHELPVGATGTNYGFRAQIATAAAAFTVSSLHYFRAVQGTLGAGSAITNQFGFSVSSAFTQATNNYGFYSDIASGTDRWNFYAAGTAQNLFAGISNFTASTASTSTTTGAVVITGGLGVGGAFYVGGAMFTAAGSTSNTAIGPSGDPDTGFYFPAANQVALVAGGTENFRAIGGNFIQGHTAALDALAVTPSSQIHSTSVGGSSSIQSHWANNTSSSHIMMGKSRGAVGTFTVVQNNDNLGQISWVAADGTDMEPRAAFIRALVDGSPGSNDMPGRLEFGTTADGADTPTLRMTINSSGQVSIAATTTSTSTTTGSLVNAGGFGNAGTAVFGGAVTSTGFVVTGSSVPANGIYLSAANTLALASNTTLAFRINATSISEFVRTTASTSTTTGAVTVAGGVGIAGALYVGGTIAAAAGAVGTPSISISGDANTGIYQHTADTLSVTTAGGVSATWDASGRYISGPQSVIVAQAVDAVTPHFQLVSTSTSGSSMFGARYSADANGPRYYFAKSRGTISSGTPAHGSVVSADSLGALMWVGSTGTLYTSAGDAVIEATARSTFSSTRTTRITFTTRQSSTLTDEFYIEGGLVMGNSPTGGAKGHGTINAKDVYNDNVALTCFGVEYLLDGKVDAAKWDSFMPEGRQHPLVREFIKMTDKFDPRSYKSYLGYLTLTRSLPGMPTQEEWAHNEFSSGDLMNRLWLAQELQVGALVDIAKTVHHLSEREKKLTKELAAAKNRIGALEKAIA
jgi:hypothetical protein